MSKVMFYVQNIYGTGHLRMILNIASGLKRHHALVCYGGDDIDVDLPDVSFHKLQKLDDDEGGLKSPGYSLDYTKKTRINTLLSLCSHFEPDFLIIEHFPFGRTHFRFEIEPLIGFAKEKNVKIFSSFRGIIGKNIDMAQLEKDMVLFDRILVHTDKDVTMPEIELPEERLLYTGYVVPGVLKFDMSEGTSDVHIIRKGIIAHVGSGRDADDIIEKLSSYGIEVYKGAYSGDAGSKNVKDHDTHIIDRLRQAEIVVCTAGYNSAVEAISARCKTILIPINKEQEIRAKNLKRARLAGYIMPAELTEKKLMETVQRVAVPKMPDMSGVGFVDALITHYPKELVIDDANYDGLEYVPAKNIELRYVGDGKKQHFFEKVAPKIYSFIQRYRADGANVNAADELTKIISLVRITGKPLKRSSKKKNLLLNLKEFQEERAVLRSYPTNLYIELTRNCNSLCQMCARSFGPDKFKSYNKAHNMSFELFKRIADELFPMALEVDLRGFGETTMLPDVEKYIDYALKFDTQYILVTNLTVRKNALWDKLVRNNFILGISFDGATRAVYEKIRRGSRFDDVMHNLKLISALSRKYKNDKIFLMVCVQKDNLHEIDKIIELASGLNIPEVELNHVAKKDFSTDSLPKPIVKKKIKECILLAERLGVRLTMSGSFGLGDMEKEIQPELQGRCPRPWSYAYVTYDGMLGPCNHRFNPPLVFSDLKKQDFADAWNSVGFQVFRKTIHTGHRFGKCNWCYKNRYF